VKGPAKMLDAEEVAADGVTSDEAGVEEMAKGVWTKTVPRVPETGSVMVRGIDPLYPS
jgi:hypothetical protein